MIELRKSPRTQVIWRAAVKLGDGSLVAAKIVNLSSGGILMHCPHSLEVNHEYRIMMEVPGIADPVSQHFKVACKALVQHCILAEDDYRIGVKFNELSDLHQNLIDAWISRAGKADHAA
ncbi:PilZ domain-containing protein [Undibacterium sp. Jales W-56]|uniref:PilZ domain-containing protein n=1 Tax=Undibacterium sp. Jales W-56 TaxID=2897325 RepID=UPI0021D2D932|nr:PilZ domain-containing protein [Undibacterium sp. Jales W-56]MCU6433017.1 PilZ domain-containing protein [Undibacterium sp. Jales W-56]